MAQKKTDGTGHPIPFTCRNSRFETNDAGEPHRQGEVHRGSVFASPLYGDENGALFLEHVTDRQYPDNELYWLMWYDRNGNPQLGASSVLGPNEVAAIGRQLVSRFRP